MTVLWWLFGHAWWGLPSLLVLAGLILLALGLWPVVLAALRNLPAQAQAVLLATVAALVAASGLYAVGLDHGEERCQSAQERVEDKADAKAAKVAGHAQAKAEEASATIRKETTDAVTEVRTIVRTVAGDCPAVPARVHELGRAAVEAASRELPAGPARRP